MKIRQFFVAKFKSSRLKQFEYNINANYNQLFYNGEIVQLADNQVLRSIRRIKKQNVNFELIDEMYKDRNRLKFLANNKPNRNKIKSIQNKINKTLYIPEYITIKIEHKKHYEYLFENGLILNGKKYKRFSCSAGQARVSTVAFVSEDILDKLNKILDNGRDTNKKLTPSKFNAYKGLSVSSTFEVSTPNFCVVKDYFSGLDVDVDFVTETDIDVDDIIERKLINMDFNRFDGMGLISPRQAKKWANELDLDYVPAQWCIRQNFIKGMLCTFDIHKFCKEKNNGNYIIDGLYGEKVDLREIDIILSEGQFKLWDSFESLETYNENCKKNNLSWGVSLYTPKQDKDVLKMNYQFLQTLDFDNDDIERVCDKFIKWADGVNGNDVYYTLLFLMGTNINEDAIKKYFETSDNYWVKSLAICNDLIQDKYIRDKIYDLVKKKINDACLGNIIVDGNFQVIVSDPYAMMEYVCGLEVKGLLGRYEYYSNYWNQKDVEVIDSMRAPMTGRSEHLVLNLKNNNELNEWYKYCYTGIVLNVHGSETLNYAGSD